MEFCIDGGTVSDKQKDLCVFCRSATIAEGSSINERIAFCNRLEVHLRFSVKSCSSFDDKRLPSLYDMREAAWLLRTERNRKVGFVAPKDRTEEEKAELHKIY